MTEHQIDALQIVLNNETVMSALKQAFKDVVQEAMPDTSGDNTIIGEKYRAYNKAKEIVEDAFVALEQYKKPKEGNQIDVRHI